jgi:hypothetical protein
MALLASLDVIEASDQLEVMPSVAVSSWKYPFARVHLPGGLARPPARMIVAASARQEVFVAKVILSEHYGARPEGIRASADDVAASGDECRLWVGDDVPLMDLEGVSLDLGQEWYELVNYPMVWGLFATLKGSSRPVMLRVLQQLAAGVESARSGMSSASGMPDSVLEFYHDDLRMSLDDLAVAGLTELQDYAFFHDLVDEVRALPIASFPDDSDRIDAPDPQGESENPR